MNTIKNEDFVRLYDDFIASKFCSSPDLGNFKFIKGIYCSGALAIFKTDIVNLKSKDNYIMIYISQNSRQIYSGNNIKGLILKYFPFQYNTLITEFGNYLNN